MFILVSPAGKISGEESSTHIHPEVEGLSGSSCNQEGEECPVSSCPSLILSLVPWRGWSWGLGSFLPLCKKPSKSLRRVWEIQQTSERSKEKWEMHCGFHSSARRTDVARKRTIWHMKQLVLITLASINGLTNYHCAVLQVWLFIWAVLVDETSVRWHFSHPCEGDVEVLGPFLWTFAWQQLSTAGTAPLALAISSAVSGLESKGITWGVFTWQSLIHPSMYYFSKIVG